MSQSDIRPASPFEEVSSEYADLLLGLGDEDLNDFDGLDDFGDGMGFKVQVALGRGEAEAPFDTPRSDSGSQSEAQLPITVGFTTAKGNKIKSPSAAAKAKAALIYAQASKDAEEADVDDDGEIVLSASKGKGKGKGGSETGVEGSNKRRKLDDSTVRPSGSDSTATFASPLSTSVGGSVFRTGSAGAAKQVPSESRLRAIDLFNDLLATGETPIKSGFTTGSGSSLPPPTSAALEKASKLFEDESDHVDQPEAVKRSDFKDIARPTLSVKGTFNTANVDGIAFQTPSKSQFTTGNGIPASAFSTGAMDNVSALFADLEGRDRQGPASSGPLVKAQPKVSGFQTGSGGAVAALDSTARARALTLLDGSSSGPDVSESSQLTGPTNPETLNTPIRKPAVNLFARRPFPSPFSHPHPSTPSERTRPETPVRPTTPSRTPLTITTNTFAQRHNENGSVKIPKSIEIKATPSRRIGLGSGSVSGPLSRPKTKSGFVSPFKVNADKPINTPTKMRTSVIGESRPIPTTAQTVIYRPVFDLTPIPNRQRYREAYLHPQYFPPHELAEMELPDEIWNLDSTNSLSYRFISENSEPMGTQSALDRLILDGCTLVKLKWIENHYSLILWKLAGIIQAKPSLFEQLWNWEAMICQLEYRYEREFGSAQRSIIRRIQEHDSASGLPMVLCVSALHISNPIKDDKGQVITPRPVLELTDGWYRIMAEVDDCLARAVSKGRIKVGRKLAISGSRLDSENDGAEVLDALHKSHLIISGNSTHLARWDAKLGLQASPFVAGLSSLSVDGGSIVLMDIVVEKVFPLAYMSGDKTKWDPPWDEKEEQIRQDCWKDKYESESKRLHEEMRRNLEKIEEIAGVLMSSAQELDIRGDASIDNVEDVFERVLGAKDFNSKLRGMSDAQIYSLAQYAQQRMNKELAEGHFEVESQLQTICPARDVRDFRVVRFSDALKGRKEVMRVGMLNVWEAKALGEGNLKEGHRYQVTNLLPGRMGDWSPPILRSERAEVYLHTRRDTRWREVGIE